MRSLFDDTKNPLFRLMCRIVNEVGAGAKYTRKEILDRISDLEEFIYVEAPESIREAEIVDMLFKFNREGFAEMPSVKNFSLPMSDTELQWLKAMLADDELFFLLPTELRIKLIERLKDVPLLYEKNSVRKLRVKAGTASGKILADKLSVAIEALKLRRKILAEDKILTACRLEYDLFADKYSLVVWREDLLVAEKILVEDLDTLSLSEESVPLEIDTCLKKFYVENVREVSLKVRNTRNAVERCFALLSSFDKRSRIREDGTYFLAVRYCVIDEEEIFEKIFSLGAMVTVIEPENFRERVIRKFSAIKSLYA